MFLANEELDEVLNDFIDVRSHRCVVTMHLVNDCLQKMGHSLKDLVFKSLYVLFHFFVLTDELT